MSKWWRRQWGVVLTTDFGRGEVDREEWPSRYWTAAGARWLADQFKREGDNLPPGMSQRVEVVRLGPFDERVYLAKLDAEERAVNERIRRRGSHDRWRL